MNWGLGAAIIWSMVLMAQNVEQTFLEKSGREYQYPNERFKVVVVENSEELGKLTALRLIQYIEEHPDGVIALPTGKTPETTIEALRYFQDHWSQAAEWGLKGERFPDTSRLKFVQLDEFFPLDPSSSQSFSSYVKKNYLAPLHIEKKNSLTMEGLFGPTLRKHGVEAVFPNGKADLNLLTRTPKTPLEKLQRAALEEAAQFCAQYEKKIQKWGGIGFFLGGIGPDGHIAFNQTGSLHNSETRLVPLNYPTAAAAAQDLGGIDRSRGMLAATIGLGTIAHNLQATAVIFAAGEGKAPICAQSIESEPCLQLPATALQKLPKTRFYLTRGAARDLKERRFLDFAAHPLAKIPDSLIDETLIELSLLKEKPILSLTRIDAGATPSGRFLLDRLGGEFTELKKQAHQRLVSGLSRGLRGNCWGDAIHTTPHHDDILLAYYPLAKSKNHQNHYLCIASSPNGVTDDYAASCLKQLENDFSNLRKKLGDPYADHLASFRKAVNFSEPEKIRLADELILLKKMTDQWGAPPEEMRTILKDPQNLSAIKGLIREAEEDRVWTLSGIPASDVHHLRSRLYQEKEASESDIRMLEEFFAKTRFELITVALDPEATGPSTHHKARKAVAAALNRLAFEHPPIVWGYRNVWDRFRFSEANLFYPISEREMNELNDTFLECYGSQRSAPFPSPSYDGPFSAYMLELFTDQKRKLETLLGQAFFLEHTDPRIRHAAGILLIQEMPLEEFLKVWDETP